MGPVNHHLRRLIDELPELVAETRMPLLLSAILPQSLDTHIISRTRLRREPIRQQNQQRITNRNQEEEGPERLCPTRRPTTCTTQANTEFSQTNLVKE